MRRRAVLIVEYTVKTVQAKQGRDGRRVVPDAERWERVFGGSGIGDLRVEVQEDKAWP